MSGYASHRYAHSRIRSRPMQLGYLVSANVINSLETVYLVRKDIAYSSLHLKQQNNLTTTLQGCSHRS